MPHLGELAAQLANAIFKRLRVTDNLGVGPINPTQTRIVDITGAGDTRVVIRDGSGNAFNLSVSHASAGAGHFSLGIEGVGIYFGIQPNGSIEMFNQLVATGTAVPTLSVNKPGANSGIATWLPVTINGAAYYIPLWS